jgi:predicted transcriptional regulator
MMTMQQFQEEKARLVATYGSASRDAMQHRAQAFARLYAQSGWTQQALAEVEHMAQSRIHQLLTFGQFLIITIGDNVTDISERRFRALWERTDKAAGDTARFAAVAAMLTDAQSATPVNARALGKAIVAQFADRKWHSLSEIAQALDVDRASVQPLLDRMVHTGAFQTFAEKRPAAKGSYAYRIVKGGKKKIDLEAFYAEAKPVMDEMARTINGHEVHFSQTAMKQVFAQFQQVIARLAQ